MKFYSSRKASACTRGDGHDWTITEVGAGVAVVTEQEARVLDVVVVGAGMVGSALACGLAQKGS